MNTNKKMMLNVRDMIDIYCQVKEIKDPQKVVNVIAKFEQSFHFRKKVLKVVFQNCWLDYSTL